MARIQKRVGQRGIRWKAEIRITGFPHISQTFHRKSDAVDWAKKTEADMKAGKFSPSTVARKKTLNDLLDRYSSEVLPNKRDPRSPIVHLQRWKEEIGPYYLSEITPSVLAGIRDKLRNEIINERSNKKRSPATVNRYLATISHAFTIAMKEWEWIDDNPVRKVFRLKEPRGRNRFLSESEREVLLNACKNCYCRDLYLAVMIALNTGARRSEVWGLSWPQVNFSQNTITFDKTKNDEPRTVPMVPPVDKMMVEKSQFRRIDTDLVFPSNKNPSVPFDFRAAWEEVLKEVNFDEPFRWHDLRHTAASYLAQNGCSDLVIAQILGHKTLSMVKRYSHLRTEHIESAVEGLADRINAGG